MTGESAKAESESAREATEAEKLDRKQQRKAARAEKGTARGEAGRPIHLCTLNTIEVSKTEEGFRVFVKVSDGRRSFTIAPGDVGQVLKDLETAIHVIRGQQ
jgi:hypothetical protein